MLNNIKKREQQKLNVRPLQVKDIPLIAAWLSHRSVSSVVLERETTFEDQKWELQNQAKKNALEDNECVFVITSGDRLVAYAHFMWINWVSRTVEVDICLEPTSDRSPFLIASILGEIAATAFLSLNLEKIYSFIYDDNLKSVRLFGHFLRQEARLHGYLYHHGRDINVLIYSLTKDMFTKTTVGKRYLKTKGQQVVTAA